MRRSSLALALAAVLVACARGGGATSTPGTALASPTAPPSTQLRPSPRPSPTPVPEPTPVCPSFPPSLDEFAGADIDLACLGGREMTFTGWLDFPPPLGFEGPGIEPGWLAYPPGNLSAFWTSRPLGPDNIECANPGPCSWLFLHVDPESGVALPTTRGWATVTGHVFDPEAERCHFLASDGWDGPLPPDENARQHCRGQFVVTSIEPAAAPG